MNAALDFPGPSRIHLALPVTDLERSLAFYETLLGVAPTKVRLGYAKFEPRDPSVNLTLNRVADGAGPSSPVGHYGVQVKSTEAVLAARRRLERAGLATSVQENTTCCYAVQDKVWVVDPDGHRWEVFVVLEADAPAARNDSAACCPATPETASAACC